MKIVLAIILAAMSFSAAAQVQVKGHFKKDGTYVAPSVRSAPNNTQADNYSTKGNVNPYNGNAGTVEAQPQQRNYNPPAMEPLNSQAPARQSGYQPYKSR